MLRTIRANLEKSSSSGSSLIRLELWRKAREVRLALPSNVLISLRNTAYCQSRDQSHFQAIAFQQGL